MDGLLAELDLMAARRLARRREDDAVRKAGDAMLLAISIAETWARIGRAAANIPRQCPEPQRGQLQALIDRIKADPQAGKAAVGLLQRMRGLRKAELAELRASD